MDNNYKKYNRAFGFGIALNIFYIIIELIFGFIANSIALISNAGHNFSDVLGLLLAWGAAYLAGTAATSSRTYGLRKSTILAALLNAIILLIAVGAISIESIRKILYPEQVNSGTIIMIVAGIGVIVNAATSLLFLKGKNSDLNIRGAFLHMAADAGISLGVVATGFLINVTRFYLLDPIISLAIIIIITISTFKLLRESFFLSMDAVPGKINYDKVKQYLESLDGVEDVHDLHIWAISTTETALTAHLIIPEEIKENNFLGSICHQIHERFGIGHSTIQIEKNAQSVNCQEQNI